MKRLINEIKSRYRWYKLMNEKRCFKMNKSDSIKELATALAKAQGEIENATKATANAFFKSKYADLAECLNTVRPVFAKHGLSLSQFPSFECGVASVESILMHSSGEWLSNIASAPVSKQDAQGVGSATTYLRRYSLAAIAGIAQEDDDANSAVGHKPSATSKPVQNGSAMDTCKMDFEALPLQKQDEFRGIAEEATSAFMNLGAENAYDYLELQNLSNDEKNALWYLFDSKFRTAIKAEIKSRKG